MAIRCFEEGPAVPVLAEAGDLCVHPLVLGGGHQLFPRSDRLLRLRLDGVDRTSMRVLDLRYVLQR